MQTRSASKKVDEAQSPPPVKEDRKRSKTDDGAPEPQSKKAKKPRLSKGEASGSPDQEKEEPKPRLTTPDLEYDYDRSQLRDPRPTPGRMARPRLDDLSMTDEFKARFHIPSVARPKGVSKNDNELFRKNAMANPSATFHDLYVCHKKGPKGSPTYDTAGYQLDWRKVDDWMKPRGYSKKGAVNGMAKRLKKEHEEEEMMAKIFFKDGKGPEDMFETKDYMMDKVSKDLGVPWHQINSDRFKEWEEKGFEKVDASEWWHRPNEEERKRMRNMHSGSSLRLDL